MRYCQTKQHIHGHGMNHHKTEEMQATGHRCVCGLILVNQTPICS